jgi:hypothetical protein
MKTIHKYRLWTREALNFGLPIELENTATVLSVQEQDGVAQAWILHDTDAPKDKVFNFRIFGTGWEITEDISGFNFIDTVQMSDGLVWHVFCEIKDVGDKR